MLRRVIKLRMGLRAPLACSEHGVSNLAGKILRDYSLVTLFKPLKSRELVHSVSLNLEPFK